MSTTYKAISELMTEIASAAGIDQPISKITLILEIGQPATVKVEMPLLKFPDGGRVGELMKEAGAEWKT